ncbi:MAG: 16S rRNA (cytosine(1402)-N(4))-methyltransferase, partial [Candidatus Margulisbacteria bacterium]|nr:16S rRNA (cytosine(1402)-N(4))-methyltransferase [Candidatus Margulisiibacteriota bacterium]
MMNHIPVLLNETIQYLNLKKGGTYTDSTLGRGGHAEAILNEIGPRGQLIAIDQ